MFWRDDDYNDGDEDDIIFPAERTLTIGWKKYSTGSYEHEFEKCFFFSFFCLL